MTFDNVYDLVTARATCDGDDTMPGDTAFRRTQARWIAYFAAEEARNAGEAS